MVILYNVDCLILYLARSLAGIRMSQGSWMSVSYECCVLSGSGLCVGLITRPEESERLWCV
jgi:hypothetical protein